MPKYLFANATGGATFSPAAMEEAEPDCSNMQVLGIAEGDTPRDAWESFNESESGQNIESQGWENEDIIAYPLAGDAVPLL